MWNFRLHVPPSYRSSVIATALWGYLIDLVCVSAVEKPFPWIGEVSDSSTTGPMLERLSQACELGVEHS